MSARSRHGHIRVVCEFECDFPGRLYLQTVIDTLEPCIRILDVKGAGVSGDPDDSESSSCKVLQDRKSLWEVFQSGLDGHDLARFFCERKTWDNLVECRDIVCSPT